MLLLCGWLVPVHLRAVDLAVIQRAGSGSPSLIDRGMALAGAGQSGPAELLLQAAQRQRLIGVEKLSNAVSRLSAQGPGANRVEKLLDQGDARGRESALPLTEALIRLENRDRALELLAASATPAVRELMRCRDLTNTVLFPPSSSSSGQAFDAALSVCGLLVEENCVATGLREALLDRAAAAIRGGNSEPLEGLLMDMMSLGQRLSWGELAAFAQDVEDPRTLSFLADQARNAGEQAPVLFAAVVLSRKPGGVAAYLGKFSQTGLSDLGTSLRWGSGSLEELLRRNQRIYDSALRARALGCGPAGIFFRGATDCALREPWVALTVKWFFYLSGGFLIAAGLRVWRAVPVIEEPLRVRGFHVIREMLFALGFLLVVLLLSEPFLAQDSQRGVYPLRLRLPGVGSVAAVATSGAKPKLMNSTLLTLLLFFVLQALIYITCRVKLVEIRRQKVVPRVQLKLLENEEHLFDAGLYLGFCGTIVALILNSLDKGYPFSLMAAYSSTSFGIIFVSIFKIFNLRPVRRQLLLLAEADSSAVAPAAPAPARYAPTA